MAVEGKHFFYRNATLAAIYFRKYIVKKFSKQNLLPSIFLVNTVFHLVE